MVHVLSNRSARRSPARCRGAIQLPADRGQRIKLIVAAVVIAIAGIYILTYVVGALTSGGPTKVVVTPAWKTANGVNEQFLADPRFHDASVTVLTEKPPTYKVVGAVRSQKDLEELEAKAKELLGVSDIEMEVELIN